MSEIRVPKSIAPYADRIVAITDRVCAEHLDEEYAALCRAAIAKLGRKRPSPLTRGDAAIWAAGVVHAIGRLNFLSDPAQTPHATVSDLSDWLGVKKTTLSNKGRMVSDALGLGGYEPEFMRRDLLDNHPLTWILNIDGLLVDVRQAPFHIQRQALDLGLIPYLPSPPPTSSDELARLAAEITVDAHDLAEQVTAFFEVFNAEVGLPTAATLAGSPIEIVGFGIAANGDEVTVECRRAGDTHEVRIGDVVFPPDRSAGWIHAAYCHCLGLTPYPSNVPRGWLPEWL